MAIILRRDKGFALTFDELDDNFAELSGGSGLIIANTAPLEPSDGQMWLDTGITQRTFAWSVEAGGVWLDISPSNKTTISETEPLVKNIGDGWFDTSAGGVGSLVLWNGASWVEVIGTGGNSGAAYGTLQEITTSGTVALDKTTGGAWVRFFGAGGSGGGAGFYFRANRAGDGWSVDTSKGGDGGEISFYVPDVSVLNGTTLTLGAPGAQNVVAITNSSTATSTGNSAGNSTWTVGAGIITATGGTGGGRGAVSSGTPVAGADGTDGAITTNTSGFVNDTSYTGIPVLYEDVNNFIKTGVADYITAGGDGSNGGSYASYSAPDSQSDLVFYFDVAGGSAGVRIVYDAV